MSSSRSRQYSSLHPLEPPSNSHHPHDHTEFGHNGGYAHHTQLDMHTHSPSFTSSAYSIASPIRFPSLNTTAFEYPISASVHSTSASEKSPSSASTLAYSHSLSDSPITTTSTTGGLSMSGKGNPSTSPVAHTSPANQQPLSSPTATRLPQAEASGASGGGSAGGGGDSVSTPGARPSRQSRKEISNVVIACRQW